MNQDGVVMSMDQAPTVQQLRESGLRVTAQRHAVLEWLIEHPHTTADQIGTGVRERLGSFSKQAVYDVLAALVEAGLVRQIEPAGHPARYERRTGDNHHHLVCRWCGTIEDADCVVGVRPCLTPDGDRGFEVDEAEVVFWGRCPTCQTEGSDHSEAAAPQPDGKRRDRRYVRDTTEV